VTRASSNGSVTTQTATLTVGTPAQVTSSGNPQNQSVMAGQKNVTFTAAALIGSPAASVQWQVSSDGGITFVPVTVGTVGTHSSAGVETSLAASSPHLVVNQPTSQAVKQRFRVRKWHELRIGHTGVSP
jgi:hypothetical protein